MNTEMNRSGVSRCSASTVSGARCRNNASATLDVCRVHSGSKEGVVYVLENDAFEGLLKIGYTSRTADVRARELSTTSVPTPFRVSFESEKLSDAQAVEKLMHERLQDRRVNGRKEFFRCTLEEAMDCYRLAVGDKDGLRVRRCVVSVPRDVDELVIKFEGLTTDKE